MAYALGCVVASGKLLAETSASLNTSRCATCWQTDHLKSWPSMAGARRMVSPRTTCIRRISEPHAETASRRFSRGLQLRAVTMATTTIAATAARMTVSVIILRHPSFLSRAKGSEGSPGRSYTSEKRGCNGQTQQRVCVPKTSCT